MQHELCKWKKHMSNEDYIYFIKYIDNAKNKLPNNKLLLFFGNEIGKKMIIREISKYLGDGQFMLCDNYGCAFLKPIVKLIYIPGIDDYQPKYIQQLINVINYGQSIIAETYNIEKINRFILDNCKTINLL
jgi:hypothetical protein